MTRGVRRSLPRLLFARHHRIAAAVTVVARWASDAESVDQRPTAVGKYRGKRRMTMNRIGLLCGSASIVTMAFSSEPG